MPTVEANGLRLYYEVHGEGEPLLCVMGLGADHSAWVLNVPVLAETHRVVVFDNRDVGQSSYVEEPYEVTDMAADALALADALELDSFHLVGMSLGGAISQELALAAPERVRTLSLAVTYGGNGGWGRQRAKVFRRILEGDMSREERVDFLMALVYSEIVFDNEGFREAARATMLQHPHPQSNEAFIRQLDAGARHETRPRLGELSMPVQVIGARRDVMIPPHKSGELAELIPDAKLTVLDCGHACNVEQAQEFNALVRDFARVRASV
ncbi:MAG: alpha/beta hydrolase [Actinomycetota bacterium]|nr:alpha/beta hydrolase [Actinomycetota bacterium]